MGIRLRRRRIVVVPHRETKNRGCSRDMATSTYPYRIPSICEKNPGVPELIGSFNLNQSVEEGQPLERQHVLHAKVIPPCLRAVKGK